MSTAPDFLSLLADVDSLQLMLVTCPEGVVVTDPGGAIVLYTGASEQIFGFAPIEVLGRHASVLFESPEQYDSFTRRLERDGRVVSMEMRAVRKDDIPFWVAVSTTVLRDRYGSTTGTVSYVRDHTRMRTIESALREKNERLNDLVEELDYVARHDQLTGLPNRGSAIDAAESALLEAEMNAQPFGVALFDLDHFKNVNDTYGHLVGDEALHALGLVMRQVARQGDIMGRFGGEEFIAFLPGAGLEQTASFAERVRTAISRATVKLRDDITINVTVSAGVAAIPGCAGNLRDAIRLADDRLFVAKRAGRNRVVSSDSAAERGAA